MELVAVYRRVGHTPLEDTRHTHDDQYEILQSLTEGGNVLIGNSLYPMTKGGVYLINAVHLHMTNPDDKNGYTRSFLGFPSRDFAALLHMMGASWLEEAMFSHEGYYFPVSDREREDIDRRMKSLAEAAGKDDRLKEARLTAGLLELTTMLFERLTPEPARRQDQSLARQVLVYIDQHYREKLTLDSIAADVPVSKYHLCHTFRKETGMTVNEYLTGTRLAAVKRRLADSDDAILDVAADAGFDSYTYFCTLFHRIEGESPSAWRKRYRRRKTE